jgi:hypothetical protein
MRLLPFCIVWQVDERLQNELQNVPPPAELPWEQHRADRQHHVKPHQHTPSHQQAHQQSTAGRQ